MKLFHFISNFEQSIVKFRWNFNSLTRKWSIIFTKGILPFWLLGGFYSCTFIICYWSHNLLNAKLHIWSKWEWAKQLSTFLSVIKVEVYISSFRYEWCVLKLCKVKCANFENVISLSFVRQLNLHRSFGKEHRIVKMRFNNTGWSKSKVLKILGSSAHKYLETKMFMAFFLYVTLFHFCKMLFKCILWLLKYSCL